MAPTMKTSIPGGGEGGGGEGGVGVAFWLAARFKL